jgi:hypothetical protein
MASGRKKAGRGQEAPMVITPRALKGLVVETAAAIRRRTKRRRPLDAER